MTNEIHLRAGNNFIAFFPQLRKFYSNPGGKALAAKDATLVKKPIFIGLPAFSCRASAFGMVIALA